MLLYKDIIKEDNPILREKSQDVILPISDDDLASLRMMNQYLQNGYDNSYENKDQIRPGVGIAAIQIGILKKMICVLAYDENNVLHEYNMINPKIVSHSKMLAYLENGEGCLSVLHDVKGYVHRFRKVKVKTHLYDLKTNTLTCNFLSFTGYLAIVFQHEYDHLQGIMYFDRINKENPYQIPHDSSSIVFD